MDRRLRRIWLEECKGKAAGPKLQSIINMGPKTTHKTVTQLEPDGRIKLIMIEFKAIMAAAKGTVVIAVSTMIVAVGTVVVAGDTVVIAIISIIDR